MKSTTKQTIIISTLITATIAVIILIINYKKMKQSVMGTIKKSYFTIEELCESYTAKKHNIDNTPTPQHEQNLQQLIDNVLNPAREELGSYIKVNSGYRCSELNKLVGGAVNSQHTTGEAADITAGSETKNKKLFAILVEQAHFDQLIWEETGSSQWIHVSHSTTRQRHQILAYNGSKYTNITNNWQNYLA